MKYTQGLWLAHGLSYSVVSLAFHVPCLLVHTIVEKISALHQEVIRLPTDEALEEAGQAVQLANSSPHVWVPLMAAMSTSRLPQAPVARITSTESFSHSYQCRQQVTPLWGIVAVYDTGVLKNSRINREALYSSSGETKVTSQYINIYSITRNTLLFGFSLFAGYFIVGDGG